MKKIFLALFTMALITSGIQLQAQTAGEPQQAAETAVETKSAPAAVKCCHGGAMKAGCGAAQTTADSKAKKSKKSKKGDAVCCASAKKAGKCCADSKTGEHSQKACHPGCLMACCAKKE